MSNMYSDIERSIYQKLMLAIQAAGYEYRVFNNQVTKKDFKNIHASISLMRISDVFNPSNGGGEHAVIRTPNYTALDANPQAGFGVSGFGEDPFGQGSIRNYTVQDWPDPFDLVFSFTVESESTGQDSNRISGLTHVRACDQLLRDTFRPRKPMLLWDSTLNNNTGGWTKNYVNYVWAGYINRDVPAEETYNRVSNIRFECFNYQSATRVEPAILSVPTLEIDPSNQS